MSETDERLQQISKLWIALCRAKLDTPEYKLLIQRIRVLADAHQENKNAPGSPKAARRVG